ncbi:MAG: tetratricopeptide repeat protein [Cytophagales bacterium]|nr:tetratricopeptide repeat protein [Cytophagales bacterium]
MEKNNKNIPLIHESYFQLMLMTGNFQQAENYIERAIKRYPSNLYYKIDKGLIFVQQNKNEEAKKYYDRLINQISEDPFKVRIAAQHFSKNQQLEFAAETYRQSRKSMDDPTAYAIQMAGIYRLLNKKEEMINEYLNYTNQNPKNIRSVKNILQNVLHEEEDLELFETMMYDKVQRSPNNMIYNELLIWINIQRKNFYSAFIQARALDKRKKLNGVEVMELGRITMVNKDYKNAVRIFEYLINEYPGTPNYQIARRLVISTREEIVKNTFPVEESNIRTLINDYRELIKDVGLNQHTIEALRSQALLYAFYLNEHDSAIMILKEIVQVPRISKTIVDKSKLDLGDIYLLIGEPWESTLLYSQVEKSSKETPIGYEAKLRNAKLSYYRGDFALAQSHLDILKMATSREIANDAMSLSLLIKDNTQLDTGDVIMKRFADIDLLIFQNKKFGALDALEKLKIDAPEHPIVDEIMYRQAELNLEMGKFEMAISLLQNVVDTYGEDILGDDALFLIGTIYEEQLKEKEKAKEVYQNFLIKYPGSSKAAEARKRFRILRGDFL